MLAAFEAALIPGVRERDLLAVLADTMLRGGGEYLATSTVCSGPNTNPWRAEATDRASSRATSSSSTRTPSGSRGAFFCVSRTFLSGDGRRRRAQRDTYEASHEWLEGTKAAVRPGLTCAEIAERAPDLPERYLPQRYECMVHGSASRRRARASAIRSTASRTATA